MVRFAGRARSVGGWRGRREGVQPVVDAGGFAVTRARARRARETGLRSRSRVATRNRLSDRCGGRGLRLGENGAVAGVRASARAFVLRAAAARWCAAGSPHLSLTGACFREGEGSKVRLFGDCRGVQGLRREQGSEVGVARRLALGTGARPGCFASWTLRCLRAGRRSGSGSRAGQGLRVRVRVGGETSASRSRVSLQGCFVADGAGATALRGVRLSEGSDLQGPAIPWA